jgi:hypothetical protein
MRTRVVLLVSIVHAGCAAPPVPRAAQAVAPAAHSACFRLEYSDAKANAESEVFPGRVALIPYSASATGGTAIAEASAADSIGLWRQLGQPGGWYRVVGDSVVIGFKLGYARASLRVWVRDSSFAGRAQFHSDHVTGSPPPSMSVVGKRESCDWVTAS